MVMGRASIQFSYGILVLLFALNLTYTGCTGGGQLTGGSNKGSPGDLSTLTWSVDSSEFLGQWGTTASDPHVIREGAKFRMFYTCADARFDLDPVSPPLRLGICEAQSTDGLNWHMPDEGDPTLGLRLRGIEHSAEENLEASFVVVVGAKTLLYYSGYTETGWNPEKGYPADLYLAISTDGGKTYLRQGKVLSRTAGGYDNDAIYSPTIWKAADGYKMIYAGHCYTNCTSAPVGVALLGATSNDGVIWTKISTPVMSFQPQLAWAVDGVAEPHLLNHAGKYYLFFTGLSGDERNIGVASSASPFGPWDIASAPVFSIAPGVGVTKAEILAPSVLIEGSKVRMWFLYKYTKAGDDLYSIRYAEHQD